jgi:hypothetical protein
VSDYSKATNFTAKDGLSTGNPAKIVKGTEIDTELTAISNAIASKSDINSPTFTGTPAAPTASSGTNTTQLATTAFVQSGITAERTQTATLTNKTLTSPTITNATGTGATLTSSTINGNLVGSNSVGARTVSTSTPTGGANGDIWYKVSA